MNLFGKQDILSIIEEVCLQEQKKPYDAASVQGVAIEKKPKEKPLKQDKKSDKKTTKKTTKTGSKNKTPKPKRKRKTSTWVRPSMIEVASWHATKAEVEEAMVDDTKKLSPKKVKFRMGNEQKEIDFTKNEVLVELNKISSLSKEIQKRKARWK